MTRDEGYYKKVINFNKVSGLQLDSWKGVTLYILGVWFKLDIQLGKNWLEVHAKVGELVWAWL